MKTLDTLYAGPVSTQSARFDVVDAGPFDDARLVTENATGVRAKVQARLIVEVGLAEAFRRTINERGNENA